MLHPDTEVRFISPEIGLGVVATKRIPRGTITWIQDPLDRVFTAAETEALPEMSRKSLETYCFRNAAGENVLCWDAAKYINHSFRPTCFSTAYDFEIAIRDIEPGEQLTDDYGYLNLERPFRPVDEGTDRKVVYPDDILVYHAEWDELIRKNLNAIFSVLQPLSVFLPPEARKELAMLQRDPGSMKSILTCHFHQVSVG